MNPRSGALRVKVRTRISRVRLGRAECRVIRPVRPLVRAALFAEPHGVPTEPNSLAMYLDRVEAVVLAALWGLATCSPRSIVYVPLNPVVLPEDLPHSTYAQQSLDLVLVHHSLQLPISRWKNIRARLGDGVPHLATVSATAFAAPTLDQQQRQHFRTYKDHVRIGLAAGTVFLTGSELAFRQEGHLLRDMTIQAGPHTKSVNGKYHYCVEFGDHAVDPWFKRKRRHPTQVHIQYARRWQA